MGSPGVAYDMSAIERARITAATEASRMGTLGDGIGVMSPLAGGQLESSPSMIRAVSEMARALTLDLVAAAERLRGVDRALDDVMRSVQELDRAGADSLESGSAPGPTPGVGGP